MPTKVTLRIRWKHGFSICERTLLINLQIQAVQEEIQSRTGNGGYSVGVQREGGKEKGGRELLFSDSDTVIIRNVGNLPPNNMAS